jgi:AraC-like DNA-binding protein
MTHDATNSTFDASEREPARGTVLTALVLGNLHAARAFGFDAEALSRAAGLDEKMLADPDGRVPEERSLLLWEAICRDPRALEFGLWLGLGMRVAAIGVVGYVMQHAADVRAALYCLERFNGLLGDGVGPKVHEVDGRLILSRTEPPRVARLEALSIAAPLGTVTLIRDLTGIGPKEPVALEAHFQHPPLPRAELEKVAASLGCPIRFNAPDTRLVLSERVTERPLLARNRDLFAYLDRHALVLQEKLARTPSLTGRLRELLVERLRDGEPDQPSIARAVGLSERTLQRRLQEENSSFAALVDEVRSDLSRAYLADPKLAIFEVAFLLGYSEPSAFNRAFRRWTGQSPSEFRSRLSVSG